MAYKLSVWMMMSLILLAGLAQGGYDSSGSAGAENLSLAKFSAQNFNINAKSALSYSLAPDIPSAGPGTELAFYSNQPPDEASTMSLLPFDSETFPSRYFFYMGSCLGWNRFGSQFPSNLPGLWIERAVCWSWYATMPWGGWARELLYVPLASQVSIYELYPMGFVTRYDLGFAEPGYYYLWYYADTPGRHLSVLGVSTGYSNTVVIDVYSASGIEPVPPKPVPPKPIPDPKEECEKRGFPCVWQDGECICKIAPNPVAECEQNPNCHWVDGQCLCTMPDPDEASRQSCEQSPNCDWINGRCSCRDEPMPGPLPGPTPEPMPGPIPGPEPGPGPSPAELCQQNPGCYWANGQCLCTGAGGSMAVADQGDGGEVPS